MIDVAIITRNCAREIIPTLESIFREIPVNRLIVVDASIDKTPYLIETWLHHRNLLNKILFIKEPRYGCGYARQLAFDSVETPIFACVDSGVKLPNGWYKELLPHLDNPETAVVAGATIFGIPFTPPLFKKYTYRIFKKKKFDPTLSNALIKTEAIKQVGGFNPHFKAGEDLDLSIRIKESNLQWIIETKVITEHNRTLPEHLKAMKTWSYGTARIRINENLFPWSLLHLLRSLKDAITDFRIHPTWLILDPIFRIAWLRGFYTHTKEMRRNV